MKSVFMLSIGIIAALASVFFWTGSQMFAKTVAPRLGMLKASALVVGVGVLPMAAYYVHSPIPIGALAGTYAIVAGVMLGLGYIFYYKSVQTAQISNVASISLIQSAILVVFGLFFLAEPINLVEAIGTLLIFVGVLLVSTTKGLRINRFLIPAIIANVLWAVFWMLLNESILISGALGASLLISRVVATPIAVFAALLLFKNTKQSKVKGYKFALTALLIMACIEGLIDGSGDVVFGIAVDYNVIALASVLGALIPICVAALAHFVYKERLTVLQAGGLAMAIVGAVAVAVL